MSDTVSSDSVAQDQLRAFIERIERLEEEKKAIADDIKEIYSEAKGNGFDVPVLRAIIRIRKMDHAERMEREALLDLYMSALGMQAAPRDDDDDPPPRGRQHSDDRRPAALDMGRASIAAKTETDRLSGEHGGQTNSPDHVSDLPKLVEAAESTERPSADAEVTTPDANTHGQTGTADVRARGHVPANAEAEAKKVGQSGQEAAIEPPVDNDLAIGHTPVGQAAPISTPDDSGDTVEPDSGVGPGLSNEAAVTRPITSMSGSTAPGPVRRLDAGNSVKSSGVTVGSDESGTAAPNSHPVANVGEEADGRIAAASDDPASREDDECDRQRLASSGLTGDRGTAASVAVPRDSSVVAFTPKLLRPHCLHRNACGGMGSQHCHSCLKALGELGGAA